MRSVAGSVPKSDESRKTLETYSQLEFCTSNLTFDSLDVSLGIIVSPQVSKS